MFRVKTSMVVPALAVSALLALSSCSGAAQQTDSAEFAEVEGTAVPVSEELAALCQQIVSEGLIVDAAVALAEASGYASRIEGQEAGTSNDAGAAAGETMVFTVSGDAVVGCVVE